MFVPCLHALKMILILAVHMHIIYIYCFSMILNAMLMAVFSAGESLYPVLTQSIIPNSPVILSHQRSITVSLETYPLYSCAMYLTLILYLNLFVKNQILDKVDLPSCERPKRPEHCPSEIYNILVSLCWSHEPHQRARFSMLKKLVDEVSAILAHVLLSIAAFEYYTCLF